MARKNSNKKRRRNAAVARSSVRPSPEREDTPTPASPSPSASESFPLSLPWWRAHPRLHNPLALLALCALVAVALFPATQAGFVWDDSVLTQARTVQTLSGLREIWLTPRSTENEAHYWPILYTTFWVEHKLWGLDPRGYHIVSLLLHLGVTLLLWRLMRRLGMPRAWAWMTAAVFAVHPTHVESATWVIGRKDLLASAFYIGCALVWLRFVEDGRRWRYGLAMLLFVLSLLSKSIAVTLPVMLLIACWWRRGEITRTDLARVAPFLLVGLAIVVADWFYYGTVETIRFALSPLERVLAAAQSLWFYAFNLVWPLRLAVIYPHWDFSVANPLAWGAVIAGAAVLAALWGARHRIGRAPLAAVLFFAVTLSPVLALVDFGYMQFSFVADRYQYLAGAGLIALGVGAAAHAAQRLPGAWRASVPVLAVAWLATLGALSWQQAGIYRDNISFYSHITAVNPKARNAHSNLGLAYQTAGRYEDALASCRREEQNAQERPADKLWNGWANVCVGKAAEMLGRLDEAEQYFRRAYELRPAFPPVIAYLGAFLVNRGDRPEEALELFKILTRMKPGNPQYHSGMGASFARMGRYADALASYDRALALAPYMEEAKSNREWVLNNMNGQEE